MVKVKLTIVLCTAFVRHVRVRRPSPSTCSRSVTFLVQSTSLESLLVDHPYQLTSLVLSNPTFRHQKMMFWELKCVV